MGPAQPPRDLRAASQWFLEQEAKLLVEEAERRGFTLTIEQVSLKPLAAGHHENKITVRPKRYPGSVYRTA